MTPELIAELAYRLTERDRNVMKLVWEHRVLTTEQLNAVYFTHPRIAQRRLQALHCRLALLRFQPWVPVGRTPWHWVLGPAGAHILAAEQGITGREFGYRHDTAMDIATSRHLGHHIGLNDFFVRLLAHARQHPDQAKLIEWQSERQCASLHGDHVRPDAFARWSETPPGRPPALLKFFLEHDTGTETLARVAAKLNGYTAQAAAAGHLTPVLFWLPSPTREANLRRLIGTPPVPVATAVHTPASMPEGPAGAVWLPAGVRGPRRRLAALADAWEFTSPPQPDTEPDAEPDAEAD
ncbi:replication-relaxation family protein [Actinomadura barringtoniae]|uniref:Replication-relaxation family protein n=1 Tax=Actinomadura barringtoniae TaxID=1427535 RepID=A0A939T745_9ACTN|nr:replication-relaxation family protein [Actinomadura barringtoniae]MBO2451629.1 replication-relaxation family protein [Actinomadura barringtoniae]